MENKHLLVVLYDSVTNSVFESQVVAPIIKMQNTGRVGQITLVTFEADKKRAQHVLSRLGLMEQATVIILKRLPLVGFGSLILSTVQLCWAIRGKLFDLVRARGPFAGFLIRGLLKLGHKSLAGAEIVLQARGLCAEEYRFVCEQKKQSWLRRLVDAWRCRLFTRIEKWAYAAHNTITIEAVSKPLIDFLCARYKTNVVCCTVAQYDLLEAWPEEKVDVQRSLMRLKLGIKTDARVYCYSGSCKPWQCAPETIAWFAQEAKHEPQAFLVVFSQDVADFQALANQYHLPKDRFLIQAVLPAQLLDYLCVADVGILLRKSDVVNWVSRPTKLLEYQALGLEVMHNGTIGML
jgi:hypothetical protein